MELKKFISKNEAIGMLETTNLCLSCRNKDDYQKIFALLKSLISVDCIAIGLVDLASVTYENMLATSVNSGYPDTYHETYMKNNYHAIDPLFQIFIKTGEIQLSKKLRTFYRNKVNPLIDLNKGFGFKDNLFYGIPENSFDFFTGIIMAGKNIENNQHTKIILKHLAPYLSLALKRITKKSSLKKGVSLTSRELEILRWLKEGKTTWEISMILQLSERGVIFHVNNILKKVNAVNRTHAVAIALENNLISL